jgi:predicted small secreted protein
MVRTIAASIALSLVLAGCGEPIRGAAEDAKADKAQAHQAVQAAEDAAKRIDELSRQPLEQAAPAGESERHE